MFHTNYGGFGEQIEQQHEEYGTKPKRGVFLDGANFQAQPIFGKIAPSPGALPPIDPLTVSETIVYDTLKPMLLVLRIMGIFPIVPVERGVYKATPPLLVYSVFIFLAMVGYIGYIKWDKVDIVKSAEGRFEEAVIGYLFTVYLIPIIISPICWFEGKRLGNVFSDWAVFERIYEKVNERKIPLFMGNKPFLITLALPILSCGTMIVTHATMVYFRIVQAIPYCYVNTLPYLIGGHWYLHCQIIAQAAIIIADDFEEALKHIGPSARVAEFRALWMLLAKITRDVGLGSCYVLTFLSLYLFLTITLTIYGLLSTLQEGFSIKDVGLTVTAIFSIALLYFICDAAHYASNCVKVNFQKKLLLVELSWMNDDAQQEINMFLRATEMNPTDMSLGGFFDVNRNLFKSLLATMVTYLVVLLQFQISIPEETDALPTSTNLTAIITTSTSTTKAPK